MLCRPSPSLVPTWPLEHERLAMQSMLPLLPCPRCTLGIPMSSWHSYIESAAQGVVCKPGMHYFEEF